MSGPFIRQARPHEAAALTEIAIVAKAAWGYPPDFMAACRRELTVTRRQIADGRVWVAEIDDEVVGFIAGRPEATAASVDALFVDPAQHGRGIGRELMQFFVSACRQSGASAVHVDADPNAEPIYRRFGFQTVGRSPSGSIPGRTLPRMELRL